MHFCIRNPTTTKASYGARLVKLYIQWNGDPKIPGLLCAAALTSLSLVFDLTFRSTTQYTILPILGPDHLESKILNILDKKI